MNSKVINSAVFNNKEIRRGNFYLEIVRLFALISLVILHSGHIYNYNVETDSWFYESTTNWTNSVVSWISFPVITGIFTIGGGEELLPQKYF